MVKVSIARDSEGFIWQYTVEGHAEAGTRGNDVVCAAISALAYTGINALEELAGIRNEKIQPGYLQCVVPMDIPDEKKQLVRNILETIIIGFKQIEYTPGYKRFISILDEEV